MKKLLLGPFLAGNELHVIKNQQVHVSKFFFEFVHSVASERSDELVHKRLGTKVHDFCVGSLRYSLMTNRIHEMGFAQSYSSVNKQRIVVITGLIGDGYAGCVSKLIASSYNKVFKRILGNKISVPLRSRRFLVFFLGSFFTVNKTV